MTKALAIDVGGTKIYCAIINENGEIISEIENIRLLKTFSEIKQTFENIIKNTKIMLILLRFQPAELLTTKIRG